VDEERERGVLDAMSDGKPPKFPSFKYYNAIEGQRAMKWREDIKAWLNSEKKEAEQEIIGMDVASGIATGRIEMIEEVLDAL
jgi:hypothetical protein